MSAPTNAAQPNTPQEVLPSAQTLAHATRLAIQQDKPIMLDYYVDTLNKKAYMGEDAETKEKMLIKSNEEFTSVIQKIYKIQEDFIILTENSLYIISAKCPKRAIQAKALRERYD
jgi:hypothetical protein